jgi:hypothetical protein
MFSPALLPVFRYQYHQDDRLLTSLFATAAGEKVADCSAWLCVAKFRTTWLNISREKMQRSINGSWVFSQQKDSPKRFNSERRYGSFALPWQGRI